MYNHVGCEKERFVSILLIIHQLLYIMPIARVAKVKIDIFSVVLKFTRIEKAR